MKMLAYQSQCCRDIVTIRKIHCLKKFLLLKNKTERKNRNNGLIIQFKKL